MRIADNVPGHQDNEGDQSYVEVGGSAVGGTRNRHLAVSMATRGLACHSTKLNIIISFLLSEHLREKAGDITRMSLLEGQSIASSIPSKFSLRELSSLLDSQNLGKNGSSIGRPRTLGADVGMIPASLLSMYWTPSVG